MKTEGKEMPSVETQAGQAQALLPRDIQQKCTMRGGVGSSCREHVDSARLEGWLLQCVCLFITWTQMYTCIDMYTHTQVFTCIHAPTKTHTHSYMHQGLFMIGSPGGGVISSNCSGVHDFWTAKENFLGQADSHSPCGPGTNTFSFLSVVTPHHSLFFFFFLLRERKENHTITALSNLLWRLLIIVYQAPCWPSGKLENK